jgi:FlaA1/EpsC-like NDP-sugar epimerase
LSLPVWVAPTFSLLAVFRLYHVVWTRAQTADALKLVATLWLGLAVSVTIAVLLEPNSLTATLMQAVVLAALSHPALLGARLVYRCAELLVPWLTGRGRTEGNGERVVLYGAGGRCQLFLKERHFPDSSSLDSRVIVGLIDDNAALHSRRVYGYRVLGGREDLPRLVQEQRLDGIVITASLTAAARAGVKQLACRLGLHLTEWRFEESELDTKLAVAEERVA